MKPFTVFSICAALVLPIGAAPFHNLSFDDAITNNIHSAGNGTGFGLTSDLLPGWQLYQGRTLVTEIGLDLFPIGDGAWSSLVNHNPLGSIQSPFNSSDAYAVVFGTTQFNSDAFSLAQMGDIPADTKFLALTYLGDPFILTLNGFLIPDSFPRVSTPTVALYDISNFAGENNVELQITTSVFGFNPNDIHYLDDIRLVPEVGSLTLFTMGAICLGFFLRREHKTQVRLGFPKWLFRRIARSTRGNSEVPDS